MASLSETKMRKRLFLYLVIAASVLFALISLVLSPMISIVSSNVVYSYTLLPDVLILLTDMLNLFALSVCCTIIIYSVMKFGMAASSSVLIAYIFAVFLKYSADMAISYLLFHTLDLSVIMSYVAAFLVDLFIVLIITFIAYRANRRGTAMKNATITAGVVVSLSKVLSRVVYDIQYGAPVDFTDLLWMIVYYLSDIIVGVIFVLISMLIFKHLAKKE